MTKKQLHNQMKVDAFLARESKKEKFFLKWNATVESFEFFRKEIDSLVFEYGDKPLTSIFYYKMKILRIRQERERLGMLELGNEGIKESYFSY